MPVATLEPPPVTARLREAAPPLSFDCEDTRSAPLYRMPVEKYEALVRAGVLDEDDNVELIEGLLIQRMPRNPPHSHCVGNFQDEVPPRLPAGFHVRMQEPIRLGDGVPEPDVAVARGRRGDYAMRHPNPIDLVLVVEVADSTIAGDRGPKLRSYARAGVARYWIVDVVRRTVEVCERPEGDTYLSRRTLGSGDALTFPAGETTVTLPVDLILPPAAT